MPKRNMFPLPFPPTPVTTSEIERFSDLESTRRVQSIVLLFVCMFVNALTHTVCGCHRNCTTVRNIMLDFDVGEPKPAFTLKARRCGSCTTAREQKRSEKKKQTKKENTEGMREERWEEA